MNGQLIIKNFGVFDDGSLSNASTTWHIHGEWFSSPDDVGARIKEESEQVGFISAEWEPWD